MVNVALLHMSETQYPDQFSLQFYEWFVDPIISITLDDPSNNDLFRELLNTRLSTGLDRSLRIIEANIENLLDPKSKFELLTYIYNQCPPKDHHYVNWFKHLLGLVCSQIILAYQHDIILKINDVVAEYWAGHFKSYSVKLYQKKGSLLELRDKSMYIVEELTGITPVGSIYDGLGSEHHNVYEVRSLFNEEVRIYIYFMQFKKKKLPINNIYICFGVTIKLWEDVRLKTIEMICDFLKKFLALPNIEIVNLNIYDYKRETSIPDTIIEAIEGVEKIKTPLKFERIIGSAFYFEEFEYRDIVREINTCYRHYCFTAMYILVRKLLENMLVDILRGFYSQTEIEKFFNTGKGHFLGYGYLIDNFQSLTNDPDFIQKADTIPQKVIDWLKLFKETGDSSAHSLFSLPHQEIIENNQDKLINLINILQRIKLKLLSSS